MALGVGLTGVLERHVIAAKRDDLGAGLDVEGVEGCAL
jgi:hypothetical protein